MRIVKIFLRVMAGMFAFAGIVMTIITYDFMQNAVSVTGKVISVSSSYSSGDNPSLTYKPTFRFTGEDGTRYTGESFISSSSYDYDQGDRVQILYDRREPSSVRIDSFLETWGFGAIFGGSAIIPFFISMFIGRKPKDKTVRTRRTRPKRVKTVQEPDHEISSGTVYERPKPNESAEDHARETSYKPTIRRNR